ncbi:MAG TPA: hypothetical protein VER96_06420 [Polyangiaceae bacterium]|nr:hypothetical protein [Polyangiaceae bacterium]
MDQGAAPNSHARKPRFFRAVPPGSKLAASLEQVRSRVWLLLVLVAACAIYFYFVSAGGLRNWPVYGTYLDLQADGFRSGHTYLPLKPAAELLRAANPRDRVNIRYWELDLSYFEGKYYTYWGPVPALVQALVKSLLGITRTIGDQYIGLVAGWINLWAGGLIIERMGRRLFGAVPRVVLIFSILAFACANPLLHSVTTAGTYVGAILSAQALLVLGVLFAFDVVWYAGTSSARRWRLWLTGLIWGLAIASRVTVMPTVAFLIGITALADAWLNERRWWTTFLNALQLGIPVALIGVGLLVYNKIRFRDPLQFGLLLQLSGYPPIDFSFKFWIPNLYRYSLGRFVGSCQFPYVYQEWWLRGGAPFPEGFKLPSNYNTDEPTVGWLLAVPLTWFIGFTLWFAPRRLTLRHRHERVYAWCLLAFGGMATLTFVAPLGVYGTTMRYLSDITPGLVLLALLGAFALRASRFGLHTPKFVNSGIIVLASVTIAMGCALGYQGYNGHFHKYNRELDATFVKALSFCGGADPGVPRFWP